MPLHDASARRRYRRHDQDISHFFGSEGRALLAQSAFVLAMPTLIVLAVVTKNLIIAGAGWGICLAVVIACWLLPRRKDRTVSAPPHP